MPDEVREHLTRDQRPFLHPESLQILQIHRSMTVLLLFSSLIFYRVQVRETWQEIRDHSFIQNHSRSFRFTDPWRCFFSSVHSSSTGFRSEKPDKRSETIPSSRITPDPSDSQIHDGASSLQFTHLLQGSGQRTPDKRSETIPSSRITPDPLDSQIHDGASSLQFTHLLQGSGQRTPDKRSDTIPSSRITPDPLYSQLHDGASSLQFTHLLQGSGQRTGMTI